MHVLQFFAGVYPSQELWFPLLDTVMLPQRQSKDNLEKSAKSQQGDCQHKIIIGSCQNFSYM